MAETLTNEVLATLDNYEKPVDEPGSSKSVTYKKDLVWRNILAMIFLHIGAIYGYIVLGLDPSIPWFGLFWVDLMTRIGSVGVTAGSHRLWCHRSYKAKLPLRIVLMILHTFSLQDDIYQWCRDHRLHHKHSDTDADPYNAQRGFFYSHIGWLFVRKHPDVIAKGKLIDISDVWADPVVRFQRRFYIPLVLFFWGVAPTYILHWLTGVNYWECFFGAVLFRYMFSLHYTWTVNSLAHLYGYQSYDKNLEPRENRWVNYATFGEGFHNFHHAFPYDYSTSEHGWAQNYNFSTMFIDACAMLGQAYDLRKVDPELISKRVERTGSQKQRKQFLPANVLLDYTMGLLFTYAVLFFTWALRFALNGKL